MQSKNENFPVLEYRGELNTTYIPYYVIPEPLQEHGRMIWYYKFENGITIMVSEDNDSRIFSVSYSRDGKTIPQPFNAPTSSKIQEKFADFFGQK